MGNLPAPRSERLVFYIDPHLPNGMPRRSWPPRGPYDRLIPITIGDGWSTHLHPAYVQTPPAGVLILPGRRPPSKDTGQPHQDHHIDAGGVTPAALEELDETCVFCRKKTGTSYPYHEECLRLRDIETSETIAHTSSSSSSSSSSSDMPPLDSPLAIDVAKTGQPDLDYRRRRPLCGPVSSDSFFIYTHEPDGLISVRTGYGVGCTNIDWDSSQSNCGTPVMRLHVSLNHEQEELDEEEDEERREDALCYDNTVCDDCAGFICHAHTNACSCSDSDSDMPSMVWIDDAVSDVAKMGEGDEENDKADEDFAEMLLQIDSMELALGLRVDKFAEEMEELDPTELAIALGDFS